MTPTFQTLIADMIRECEAKAFETSDGDARRNYALSKTALEDALMRFNRATHLAAGTAAW